MNPSQSSRRRTRKFSLGAEALESRALLTGGAGNTFAMETGTISQANGTTAITFTIDPSHFTLPKHAFTLGVDVVANSGDSSTVQPLISSIDGPNGKIIPQAFHSIYDPHLSHAAVAAGKGTSAVLVPISVPKDWTGPLTYTVNVQAESGTSGDFLLGFYLPGDVDGNGTVDQSDLKAVKSERGLSASNTNYNFEADANRDGRIGSIDIAYTKQNLGVSTTITPAVSANLDPASVGDVNQRNALSNTAHFTGTGTPGATITYIDSISNGVPSTAVTVDDTGNYSVNVPLGNGVNTFTVTSTDPFGQTISGQISPVTYSATPPVTASSLGINPNNSTSS